ncbi:MAG: hypothetical protein AAFV54_06665 [Pseudomonadota bacterium]
MVRAFCFPVLLLLAACGGGVDGATATAEQTGQTAEPVVTVELCTIMKGDHLDAPDGGNVSTTSSNGVTISVMGSRSQSVSSAGGLSEITVSGAATLHLTFPDGEKTTVQTSAGADLVRITIDGPDAITCEAVI